MVQNQCSATLRRKRRCLCIQIAAVRQRVVYGDGSIRAHGLQQNVRKAVRTDQTVTVALDEAGVVDRYFACEIINIVVQDNDGLFRSHCGLQLRVVCYRRVGIGCRQRQGRLHRCCGGGVHDLPVQ